jgi:ABC-type nickel/cobalt efflux system permease component RcnA
MMMNRYGVLQVQRDVAMLSETDRKEFFDAFRDDPLLSTYGNVKIDTAERVQAFLDIPEESLYKLIKMQMVLLQDAHEGGGVLNQLLLSSAGPLPAMKRSDVATSSTPYESSSSYDHDHSHGHEHVHSQECSHGHQPKTSKLSSSAHSTSSSTKMDR